jgi:tripartite-type tricarboxylate transporter receptor subunit TctC
LLCTKKDFPANSGKELVEEIRKNPGKYTYGNDGIGATIQLAVERILHKLDLKARGIPYGGAGETLKAFLGGHIDIYAGSIAPIQPYLKEGSAKCLIVTSAERNAALPQAASLTDLGIPDEGTVLWRGIVVPNGLPADRVAFLEKVFREAAQTPRFKEFMKTRGEEARGSTGTELRALIDSEYAAMGKVMKAIGLVKQ